MIQTLRIKNLALAENTLVEFGSGLNVITGETGAGKSILIGALGLLLGNRADKSLIRTGEEACGAEAVFLLKDADAINEALADYGLEPCEENQLVIRRVVRAEGPGQIWVNDAPVTLQALKRLGDLLVDIHGPHDHQSLLQPDAQIELLDSYSHAWKEREAYETAFGRLRELEQRIADLQQSEETIAEQLDVLGYRVKELEQADLREDEEEELLREHTLLGNAQRIQELGSLILQTLSEGDPAAFDLLVSSRQHLARLADIVPDAAAWRDEIEALTSRLQELSSDISRTLADIEHNPDRLAWLDERLAVYQRMKRKYGPHVGDILETFRAARQKLSDLETRGEQLEALQKEQEALNKSLTTAALALRKKRQAKARELARAIESELQALGLKNSAFQVRFEESEPRASGMDRVDFEFAPNAGENKQPLRLTASSGEMSRVMLAAKTVLAAHDRIPVLVFDEIDSNVGGETAKAVGLKLAELSHNHQVLCVTHFPQVAVHGQTHLAVRKKEQAGRTHSSVVRLEDEARVDEIARMLGGRDLTSHTLDHAREMLELARGNR